METSAERRGEVFELMRFSRFLHKLGMNKLPAQQDQTPACKEGLAKIDGNMVRYATQPLQLLLWYLCVLPHNVIICHGSLPWLRGNDDSQNHGI